jgi:signal transduction histidine kinase
MRWRRFDTLFVRLFVLMGVAFVLSSIGALLVAVPMLQGPQGGGALQAGLRPQVLWLDFAIRVLVIALFAAVGARWLLVPLRRLTAAARQLTHTLREGRAVPALVLPGGSAEGRDAVRVFNDMAARLQEQFDLRSLHLAAVSHDLRTPLARIRLRLERIDGEGAGLCIRDVQEMNDLVDNSVAVLWEQREAAPPSRIDIGSLLQAVADDQSAVGNDVSVLPHASGAGLLTSAHPAGLRRVVVNVVGNAVRYGARARLAASVRDDRSIVVQVDDDGPGIPSEQMETVLQPWVRLQTASSITTGYGLGLAIARDLLERDGATLALSNRPEGGLRVELVLPAA